MTELRVGVLQGPVEARQYCKIQTTQDLINACVSVMEMVPPFRNFTINVFSSVIKSIQPDYVLSNE